MNTTFTRSILFAAVALGGFWASTGNSALIHSGNVDSMSHWYGRAGGPAGLDAVIQQTDPRPAKQSVQITYSKEWAQWTNMPRSEGEVGPVTDSFGITGERLPEMYGRAGDAQLLEEIQNPSAATRG